MKDITRKWSRDTIKAWEEILCDMRNNLEELAEDMRQDDVTIDESEADDVQDIADQVAHLEDYLFSWLEEN